MSPRLSVLTLLALFGCDAPADGALDAAPADAPRDVALLDAPTRDVAADDASPTFDTTALDAGPPRTAADWIREHFADDPEIAADVTARTRVETPVLVHDLDACCAKYAFDVREEEAPVRAEVAFVNVTIHDLVSPDAFGAGIQSSGAPGLVLYLANVSVDPGWPTWVSYASTNYDGLVLDGASAIYAEDLTIRDWNGDAAIDDKAPISQFVRLTLEGSGHRGIRFWEPGPHYVVDSTLRNEGELGEGSLFWFSDCDGAEVRIYRSTFNGEASIPASLVRCDAGSAPNLVYLETDPRTTGEMHPMFGP